MASTSNEGRRPGTDLFCTSFLIILGVAFWCTFGAFGYFGSILVAFGFILDAVGFLLVSFWLHVGSFGSNLPFKTDLRPTNSKKNKYFVHGVLASWDLWCPGFMGSNRYVYRFTLNPQPQHTPTRQPHNPPNLKTWPEICKTED